MKKLYFFAWLCIACSQTILAQNNNTAGQPVKISGVVTNDKGESLPGVTIFFNNEAKTITDNNGNYSLEVSSGLNYSNNNNNIGYKLDGYNYSSRSFHPQMGNTGFNVTLSQPCRCDSAGCFRLPDYNFDGGNTVTDDDKKYLSIIKDKMISHPECNISISGFAPTKNGINTMADRLGQMQQYLEKLGITPDRVIIETKNGEKNITIEVIK